MKSIIIASVLFAGGVWAADEAADRASIENTIRVFSVMPSLANLYAPDFDREEAAPLQKAATPASGAIPVIVQGVAGTVVISKEPMGEATWFPAAPSGSMTVRKIRFVTPEVALVDVTAKSSWLFVLKKVGTDWKIASVRPLAEPLVVAEQK